MAKQLCIRHTLSPGDIVVFTSAIRDLALNYPSEYEIHVHSSCVPLWNGNPYIAKVYSNRPAIEPYYTLDYGPYIGRCHKEPQHFIKAMHSALEEHLHKPVPVLFPHGDLHLLTDWHKENSPIEGRYCYLLAGGKGDFTTKHVSPGCWQKVVDLLRPYGIRFVQDGALHKDHYQPALSGVLSTVGRTNLVEMSWLIYHADIILCGITSAMHIAAAFQKPAVIVAAGREHFWWEYYGNLEPSTFGPQSAKVLVPHHYLHTIDMLDCCTGRGCWMSHVSRSEPDKHNSYCKHPVITEYGDKRPLCIDMVTPEHIAAAVLSYYENGTLTL